MAWMKTKSITTVLPDEDAMKETPQEKRIHNNMKAGVMSANGFLGDDRRHYHEIIET